jgi:hypothetical protein
MGDRFVAVNGNPIAKTSDLNDLLGVKPGTYNIQLMTKDGKSKQISGEIRKSSKEVNRVFFVPKK